MSPQHPKRRVTQQHQVQVTPVQAIQVSYSMTNVGGINPNLESYLMNLAMPQIDVSVCADRKMVNMHVYLYNITKKS